MGRVGKCPSTFLLDLYWKGTFAHPLFASRGIISCLAHPIWRSFLRPCTVLSVVHPLIVPKCTVLNTITFVEVKCIWWVQFLGINKQCNLFPFLPTIQNVFRCPAWLMASLQIIFFTCLCAYCFLILSVFQVSFKPNSMISFENFIQMMEWKEDWKPFQSHRRREENKKQDKKQKFDTVISICNNDCT